MIFYEKESVLFKELSLFALLLFHIKSLLSVPFYDIISANNVETEHENEEEFDEAQNTIHDPVHGSNGKKSRNEKELTILRIGHSYEANQEQDSSYDIRKGNSNSGINNGEGQFSAHFLNTLRLVIIRITL